MNLDVIRTSATGVAVEMLIPWQWVGSGGGLGSVPVEGRMVALSGGYNDADGLASVTDRTMLRWKEKDPFNPCTDMTPPHDYCDSWGDIKFGPTLDGASAVADHHTSGPVASKSIVSSSYHSPSYVDIQGRHCSHWGSMRPVLRIATQGNPELSCLPWRAKN
jgi:hypothetical protein